MDLTSYTLTCDSFFFHWFFKLEISRSFTFSSSSWQRFNENGEIQLVRIQKGLFFGNDRPGFAIEKIHSPKSFNWDLFWEHILGTVEPLEY